MKNTKRRFSAIFVTIGLALGMVLFASPGVASAHGYISSPMSRQGQCAAKTVSCGSIQWEPQSVEGLKGLRNCHGNVARFAELSDDSKGWTVHSVGRTVAMRWTFTAPHRTSNFEYYIGNTKVGDFSGNMQQPPNGLTHNVNLGSFSGRQKLLAIWNIGDTAMAFYVCVDLNIS